LPRCGLPKHIAAAQCRRSIQTSSPTIAAISTSETASAYWETCGDPAGKPAVVLHGGPGSGCGPGWRRFFDPDAYRIVLFDQRGCGRSTPHASDPSADLSVNTTHHLVADIERLRRHLGIERWLVFGGSWGSTLALAYAREHADHISEMVLFSVGTTTRREVEWLTDHAGRFFPEAWRRFRDGAQLKAGERIVDAYARLLADQDPAVREAAAKAWCAWEDAHVALSPDHRPDARYEAPRFRMAFARLVTHYFRHAAWLEDGELVRAARGFGDIPAVLIHGQLDLSSPPDVAFELSQAWPNCRLVRIPDIGHGARDARMARALVEATDRFARGS
jgi:proline iminopeptidase